MRRRDRRGRNAVRPPERRIMEYDIQSRGVRAMSQTVLT